MELELRHLRVLTTVAQAGSITEAARLLVMAQPNLTRLLRRIEEGLGGVVFERTATGVVLTGLGHQVVDRARTILELSDDLMATAEEITVRGLLRVRTFSVRLGAIQAHLPHRLRERRWSSEEKTPDAGIRDVREQRAEVFFGMRWPHASWPVLDGLSERVVLRHPMCVMIAATNPLAREEIVDLAELRHMSWIAQQDLPTTASECARFGFAPKIDYRSGDRADYLGLVGADHAVAFTRWSARPSPDIVLLRYHDSSDVTARLVHDEKYFSHEDASAFADAVVARHADNLSQPPTEPR